jgi:predicted aconitase with swiveling domain
MAVIHGKGITRGRATGEAVVCPEALSFLGDLDMGDSRIVAAGHPHAGTPIAGRVLVFPGSRGSGSANVILTVLARHGLAPAAIVNRVMADPNLVEGVILARLPLVCRIDARDYERLHTGMVLTVDAAAGTVSWEDPA